jgi:hypothetical protein
MVDLKETAMADLMGFWTVDLKAFAKADLKAI